MEDDFLLTVNDKGQETSYTARLLMQGYTYKIIVTIGAVEVYFEPDDAGSFRAVSMPGQDEKLLDKTDKGLLELLTQRMEAILA